MPNLMIIKIENENYIPGDSEQTKYLWSVQRRDGGILFQDVSGVNFPYTDEGAKNAIEYRLMFEGK